MTTLNKIHPIPNIHDEYGIIVDSVINAYDDYSILTSDDDDNEIIKDQIRPSVLVKNSKSKNIKTYSDTNSDTDSDGYNENNIISNARRRPSFIRKSLKTLSTRIEASPDHIKDTLIDTNNTNNTNNQNSYFGIFKRKTILGLSLISGTILSLIFIL